MENKILQDVEELQTDFQEASKRISDSFDRMIVMCDSVLEILKSMNNKIDKY